MNFEISIRPDMQGEVRLPIDGSYSEVLKILEETFEHHKVVTTYEVIPPQS